ncbi:MAG TPA: DUF362 domain-containing protein [Desulfurivibrionaceae bacterium]|nr:DUF362 domain-containing protein [Desulfurivibrionaceae bacterium]
MITAAAIPVALAPCRSYGAEELKAALDQVLRGGGLVIRPGMVVLLKPNLVSAGSGPAHLACTSPSLVAAVAEWCLDQGARVQVGDSPAFGSGRSVMRACGMLEALAGLPVEVADFDRSRRLELPCGLKVPVAAAALECDLLLNLPRIKAHGQLYVSLAVKNYFGVVAGWHKALHHARHGDLANRFEALLADLPALFPGSFSLVDGVVAMQRTGPMRGEPFPLALLAGGFDPVALDTAILEIIGADPQRSQLWVECQRRGQPGTDPARLAFPLARPEEFKVENFLLPEELKPVTFHPVRVLAGGCRRLAARIFPA